MVERVDLLHIRRGKGFREEPRVKEERIGKLRRNLAHCQCWNRAEKLVGLRSSDDGFHRPRDVSSGGMKGRVEGRSWAI
jgi:hypothetical protein